MKLFDQFSDFDDGLEANPFREWDDQADDFKIDIDAIIQAADAYDDEFGEPPF